ncbi:unnamed protein product [Didymodactylos carnosus]|uniref:Protein kinase domain-containing protein n=1 Tax=Didymodactylos carnosus TaxID=1234261 RepID=A0A814L4A9_9BILA|nr:unnamed protein product [Didymodactylos carnosus]CAF1099369.1 unnamed protein product [Didymodactylos carnosus]CAF3828431.1 unnamed protein product [Didymodactylos carnosus]CAF3860776.1 unnamed protein product [Didymodactylos carnosus]
MTTKQFEFPYISNVSQYVRLDKIGQGTFGAVFKAKCKKTNDLVAMKLILMYQEKEGFPITALREIQILQELRHDNIVRLMDICRSPMQDMKSEFYLIFEFCDHDLAGILRNGQIKFTLGHIKSILQQLLNGLYYIHKNDIIHRDLKSANILLTRNGLLKLADFGLARVLKQPKQNQVNRYTCRVVTLWYRPPELLLGQRDYSSAIDMWGVGCIMCELWTRTPILQGDTEQRQLELISYRCGSIEPSVWPGLGSLPLYSQIHLPKGEKRKIRELMHPYTFDASTLDLIDKLLTLDPKQRIDADLAMSHDFFYNDPPASELGTLLSKYDSMFELKEVSRMQYQNQKTQQQQQQQQHRQKQLQHLRPSHQLQMKPNMPKLPSEQIY